MGALAKEPGNQYGYRYGSAAEMLAALEAAEASPELAGHTERYAAYARKSRRWWWIAALVVLLLAGGALAYVLTRDGDVRVPSVKGQDVTDATLELQRAGFEVDLDRIADPQDEGTVLDQDPRGGQQAKEGSTVNLDVSLGPAPVKVADVSGLAESQARRQLEDDGFKVDSEQQFDEDVDAGLVIETSPSAETELAAGETVTLIVSEGTESVQIPDVLGLDRFDAKSTLEDAGFKVDQESQDGDEPKDQVIRQLPAALEERSMGSTVTIVYSNGAGTIVLEDFVGETQSFAERRLGNQGLSVRVRTESVDNDSEDGIVLSQTPEPDTRLSPGDRVTIVVGEFTAPDGSETP